MSNIYMGMLPIPPEFEVETALAGSDEVFGFFKNLSEFFGLVRLERHADNSDEHRVGLT